MATKRQLFARQRRSCGFTQETIAEALGVDRRTIQRWERGESDPQPWQRPRLAKLLNVSATELDALLVPENPEPPPGSMWVRSSEPDSEDELDALELVRRVQASDVGPETLGRLENVFDELARAYPKSAPHELLGRVRKHIAYVGHLLDARKTLEEHRRLLVVGGWLSLLGATLHIDLKQVHSAGARLKSAKTLAQHAEHSEIEAWVYETSAWHVLTEGDYTRALELSQRAQSIAPTGSSVAIQATAQEGRARARLAQVKETRAAIDRVQRLSTSLELTTRPEHHYQYDPAKSLSYTATTLAWLGDSAAETYAREVITRLGPADDVSRWPRRVASANIDLALTLLTNGRMDEACDAAQRAILSGRVVPSNHWRALEVVRAVETRRLPEASDLRDAYEGMQAPPRTL